MKLIKTANGKRVKMSKSEWQSIGKKAGWMREAFLTEEERQLMLDKSNIPLLRNLVKSLLECTERNNGRFDEYDVKEIDELIQYNSILSKYANLWETFKKALNYSASGDVDLSSGHTLLRSIGADIHSAPVGEPMPDQRPTKDWNINNI